MAFKTVARRRNPWSDLFQLQEEMGRLFDVSLGDPRGRADFLPPIDVLRNEDSIIIRADMPGVSKENFEVTILNNRLIIRGEKKQQQHDDKATSHQLERFFGRFERTIDLPVPVNPEDIRARFEDGVLEVTAPVSEVAKPRRVAVEVKE